MCKQYYSGEFCDKYNPPPTDPPTPEPRNDSYVFYIALVIVVVAVFSVIMCVFYKKRRRYARGFTAQPQTPIPGSTGMHTYQAPQDYPPYPTAPMLNYPPTSNPGAETTSYSFQPSEGNVRPSAPAEPMHDAPPTAPDKPMHDAPPSYDEAVKSS